MAVDPETLNDPNELRSLIKNALRLHKPDLALQCQVRIANLEGAKFQSAVEGDFWKAVIVAEELATQRNGKTTKLSRTRQKEKRVGYHQCLVDWAVGPGTTEGFKILTENGYPDLTGEAIVLKHASEFTADVVAAARAKLVEYGVDVSRFSLSKPD